MKVNEIITNEIVNRLESGDIPWFKPWNTFSPKNIITNRAYSGFNRLYLGCLPYEYPYFATFKQVKEKGGKIKSGAKSEICVFWNIQKKVVVENNKTEEKTFPILRFFKVFNICYIDGIEFNPEDFAANNISTIDEADTLIDIYLKRENIDSKVGSQASYTPSLDYITMPPKDSFKSQAGYYSTYFHEIAHSTGAKNRLNRLETTKFGTSEYAKEELVAEIAACFLCGKFGLERESLENTAAYCQSWIKALKNDKNMIISAASMAEKAENFIYDGKKE